VIGKSGVAGFIQFHGFADVDFPHFSRHSFGRTSGQPKPMSENACFASLGRLTTADCAVFPYVATGWEGGVTLERYPAVQAWIERMKALPGYIGMPGIK